MREMNNWVLRMVTILAAAALLVGCSANGNNETNSNSSVSTNNTGGTEEVAEDAVRITISLNEGTQFINETEVPYEEGAILMDVLEENFFVEQENGDITSIERMEASEEDNTAWMLYVNDELSSVGAAEYEVQPGDKIVFDLQSNE